MAVTRIAVAVDVACFALDGDYLSLLLVKRTSDPEAGSWALPGGVLQPDETLAAAAARLLQERTEMHGIYLEQLYTFDRIDRDPRGRTISVAYYALLPRIAPVRAGRGVSETSWNPITALPRLAFDHDEIAAYAYARLQQKITYTPLAFRMLPETFTMTDLRRVYESVLGQELHPSNFARQMLSQWDLAPVPEVRDRRSKRPARLYRFIGRLDIAGPPPAEAIDLTVGVTAGEAGRGGN
jgi:8-oxo-dGTP diphosphatase